MSNESAAMPDHTAVRVALWRALHVHVDAAPYVLEDEIGLRLVSPDSGWHQRPDMNPQWTSGYRASIVGRARLIEDLVLDRLRVNVNQYVIIGAGLDTFAQRKRDLAAKLRIFEIDNAPTQNWKRQRLIETGLGVPDNLHFVPVDFEAGELWVAKLAAQGFALDKPAVVASAGVSMYLTRDANKETLQRIAAFAPGSTFAMTFMLPTELVDPAERAQYEMVQERTRAAGTPFISLFGPSEILEMARGAGFKQVQHLSTGDMIQRYFAGRSDGLRPATGEEFLIAST